MIFYYHVPHALDGFSLRTFLPLQPIMLRMRRRA